MSEWTPLKEEQYNALKAERQAEMDARLKALEDLVADYFRHCTTSEQQMIISFAINDPGSLREAARLGELFAEMGGTA